MQRYFTPAIGGRQELSCRSTGNRIVTEKEKLKLSIKYKVLSITLVRNRIIKPVRMDNTLYLILEKYLILISRILADEVLSIDFRT